MSRLIGEHWENDVRVRYVQRGEELTVERSQDAQATVDRVAGMNAHGVKTIDGLGKPMIEVPVVTAMAWAQKRGIPWEKLLYSNDYDAEFKAFAAEHSRLCFEAEKSHFAVTA